MTRCGKAESQNRMKIYPTLSNHGCNNKIECMTWEIVKWGFYDISSKFILPMILRKTHIEVIYFLTHKSN